MKLKYLSKEKERKRTIKGDFTFYTRVKDAKSSPVNIAIHGCQVIDIEINRCIAWTMASWFDFGKYAKTGG